MSEFFATEFVSPHVTRVLTPLGDCVYLVEGAERALLLDTGYGIGDLRGYVESLVAPGKPIDVVLSHGHVDHVGGASQWERVYMSHEDLPVEREHGTVACRWDFICQNPKGKDLGITEADLCQQFAGEFLPLGDGDEFDLGDVTVRMIGVPGHTLGMMVPVVLQDRVAVFGDATGEHTMLQFETSLPIASYVESLRRLKSMEHLWDHVVRNHGTHVSPKDLLDRNIWLCERILADEDDKVPAEFFGTECFIASANHEPGVHGNIVYKRSDPRGRA